MTSAYLAITLSPRDYDAVLFDLDGVPTRTVSVHAAAWKKLFDGFLEHRAIQPSVPAASAALSASIDTNRRRHCATPAPMSS